MIKFGILIAALGAVAVGVAQTPKHDNSTHHKLLHAEHRVHHAGVHAEHWISRHVSSPHRYLHGKRVHDPNTVRPAINHASKWLNHHLGAPKS